MPIEMVWEAEDKKAGMTMKEMEQAISVMRQTRPGEEFRLKATVGFKQQIQKLTFTGVKDADSQKA